MPNSLLGDFYRNAFSTDTHPAPPVRSAFEGLHGLAGLGALLSPNALLAYRPPRKRVFTSFQRDDLWAVQYLRAQADNDEAELDFYDESLQVPFDSVRAEYIKAKLRERIARTSVTICLVGQRTRRSKWVSFELMESFVKGNRVIGMAVPGATAVPYPRFFEQAGAPVNVWNLEWLQQQIDAASPPVAYKAPA